MQTNQRDLFIKSPPLINFLSANLHVLVAFTKRSLQPLYVWWSACSLFLKKLAKGFEVHSFTTLHLFRFSFVKAIHIYSNRIPLSITSLSSAPQMLCCMWASVINRKKIIIHHKIAWAIGNCRRFVIVTRDGFTRFKRRSHYNSELAKVGSVEIHGKYDSRDRVLILVRFLLLFDEGLCT